jgi:hypothetical protein
MVARWTWNYRWRPNDGEIGNIGRVVWEGRCGSVFFLLVWGWREQRSGNLVVVGGEVSEIGDFCFVSLIELSHPLFSFIRHPTPPVSSNMGCRIKKWVALDENWIIGVGLHKILIFASGSPRPFGIGGHGGVVPFDKYWLEPTRSGR